MLYLVLCCLAMAAAKDPNWYKGSYFITYSNYMERGMPYNFNIEILNTTQPVNIHAEIQRVWNNYTNTYRHPVTMTDETVSKGGKRTLSMNIPKDLASGTHYLHIRGSGGLQFEREAYVRVAYKPLSIMVQTDKAIYKPGQLVHFRAFAVYPNLQVYTGKFDITLSDPNRNTLRQWTGRQSSSGVVAGEFQLADKAVFGDWKFDVQAEEQVISESKKFTVAEYQLPRFKVTVELPPYSLMYDQLLSGTVKAEYTFGRPVKGMVEIHAYQEASYDYCGRPPKYVELAFPTDGETKFDIPVADLHRLTGNNLEKKTFVVTAIVKEELTGVRLNGSSLVTFHKHPYKIEILSSSPKTFSPKLPYTAFVKVSQQDGRPVTDISSPVGVYTCVNYRIVQDDQNMYSCNDFSGRYSLPPKNYTLPASGIIPIDMPIPENTTSIDVKVHYKDIYTTTSVNKKYSISDNFMQIRLVDKTVKAGQSATFSVEHTEDVTSLTYEVIARGIVVETGVANVSGRLSTFTVPITTKMSPVAHVIAFYIREDGEVIADSLSISVDDIFDNKVSIAFSRNESKPHQNVDVLVTADPQSSVNLLAVDQSVLLLKSGNDISPKQVYNSLKDFDTGTTNGDFSPEVAAISSSGTDAESVFSDAGLKVITDAWYYDNTLPPGIIVPTPYPIGFTPYPGATPYPGVMPNSIMKKEVTRVRTEFPETWLWTNFTIGSDGKATVNATVPDTITSWIASAFAVNSVSGLGVAPATTKLRVFQPFFVSLSMPVSVLRGETVVVQASVFNYLPSDADVAVSLPSSSNYVNVAVDSTGKTSQESKDQIRQITVKSKEPVTVYFPIIPSSLGAIDIEVSARSPLAADAVKRQLLVQPEGIPKEYTIPAFIDLSGGSDFNQNISLSLPPEFVTGSERVQVKVTGDLIGASLDSLENLLSMPTGCGEQNMMSFAPDLYIADYLTSTKQMTPALEAKITDYLQLGYQRELTYQRTDGSFSPFGDRDASGSMWLTAFVTTTFHQARPYIFVGNSTLIRALQWMASRQNIDGSFNEPGLVINRQIQESGPALTAMVLLSFLENSDMDGYGIPDYMYGNVTLKARAYLEFSTVTITDTYTLAVVSYALAKMGSALSAVPFNKLTAAARVVGHMKYWDEKVANSPTYYTKWTPPNVRAQPINIQTTAFALLASSARGDLKGGLPITNWLSAQRNPYGGFSSTQDTMVALQALTDYATRAHTTGFKVELDIQTGSVNQHLSVNDKNALALQSRNLLPFPNDVLLTATGKGVAYAEIDAFFNVEAEIGKPAFDISAVLLDDNLNNFRLMTCTKWLKTGSTGMAVMEISIPTGFDPDMTSIGMVAGIKRAERRGRNVVVYFDEIGTTSICFDILATRTGMVTNNQQSYITVYDYYQPDNQASIFYQPRSLKKSTICDVCAKCCPQVP